MVEKVHPDVMHSGITMTVGELKELLSGYPDDIPVLATWESVLAGLRVENFRLSCDQGRDELVIDVEDYG